MLGWLWRTVIGSFRAAEPCSHRWQTVQRINVYSGDSRSMPVATKYVLRCDTCGDIRKREV